MNIKTSVKACTLGLIVTLAPCSYAETPSTGDHAGMQPGSMMGGMQHGGGMMMGGGMQHGSGGMMGMGSMGMMGGMMGGSAHGGASYAHLVITNAEELKLSDEQLGKITRLHLTVKKAHQPLMDRLSQDMSDLRREVGKPNSDETAIRNAAKELTAAIDAMVEHHLKERKDVNALLTSEQQTAVKNLKTESPMM